MNPGFAIEEHTADLGVRAWGALKAEVFVQAALGMASLICDPATVTARERLPVTCEAPADDLLLAAWLNELLYLSEARGAASGFVFAGFRVDRLAGGRVEGLACGEPAAPGRHEVHRTVKAATLHKLSLHPVGGGWEAFVILDV